ncbi:MAG: precorrin-6y C5,15-methyltransferase (decarboxylating) subunit CbiE [Alphaproteobacteria bacterium]|jgi:precorrin-6Y C5,15-methyltransferase (decarboxylating)|nr:precorrin-6y C5,15-methyltransferase (decarboxylating) subunit CbiE [Alphaproteobacteria bacterium]
MSGAWLSIVGIGGDGLAGLGETARAMIAQAEVLVGDARTLDLVSGNDRLRLTLPDPPSAILPDLAARRGTSVCVIAPGDPLLHGIGSLVVNQFPRAELRIVPSPSAYALACARLGWPRDQIECLNFHGRDPEGINAYLYPKGRFLVLTSDGSAARRIARALTERGFGPSRITVLEDMGGPNDRQITGTALNWSVDRTSEFNTVAIECVAGRDALILSRAPGLPDQAYRHEGWVMRREVRAVSLAALSPLPGQLLWDLGSGGGSIAIEWLRVAPRGRAIAVEPNAARADLIDKNAIALGTPELEVVAEPPSQCLARLVDRSGMLPNAIFIGGGLADPGLVEACWSYLAGRGRLVANAESVEEERVLLDQQNRLGGDIVRLTVARAVAENGRSAWQAQVPVTQWVAVKQ